MMYRPLNRVRLIKSGRLRCAECIARKDEGPFKSIKVNLPEIDL